MVTDEPSDSFPNQQAWYSSIANRHTPDLNIQKYGITVKSVKQVKHSKKKHAERCNTMHCTTNVFQVFRCLECDVTSMCSPVQTHFTSSPETYFT